MPKGNTHNRTVRTNASNDSSDQKLLSCLNRFLEIYPRDRYKKILAIGVGASVIDFLRSLDQGTHVTILEIKEVKGVENQMVTNDRAQRVAASADDLAFPDELFDLVVCNELFSFVPNHHNFMRELMRVLKPGMPLVLSITSRGLFPRVFAGDGRHKRNFSARELSSLLRNYHMTGIKTSSMISSRAIAFGKKYLFKTKYSGVVHLPAFEDQRGGLLLTAEFGRTIPFEAKRVYVISNVYGKDAVRGGHAHKKLDQVIFCISGSFELRIDDGKVHQKVVMRNNGYGMRLGPKLWHSMRKFSRDCVILVFASDFYDESDYIRDYTQFKSFIAENP